MSKKKHESLDSIFDNLESLFSSYRDGGEDLDTVSFWIPSEYKAKYELLQKRTKCKFGKFIKEVLKRSIDRALAEGPKETHAHRPELP